MRLAALWAAFCSMLALAAPARSAEPLDAEPRGTVTPAAARPVVSGGLRQGELDASASWRAFRAQHGAWVAAWNERTGTPHRAFGPAFALPGAADDAAAIDGAVRGFVADHPALFGAPALTTVHVEKAGHTWYARYQRTLNGVPVLFEDWEFRVGDRGRLEMFGADAHLAPASGAPTDARARIVRTLARQAALRGLDDTAGAQVTDGGTAYLPLATAHGTDYRLVYEQQVATDDPPHRWYTLVDAHTGEVLWRQDRVRYALAGKVTGLVHPVLPSDALSSVALPNLNVFVNGTTVVTDSLGNYTSPASGTVTVTDSLVGLYCDVNDDLPPPGRISTTSGSGTLNLAWDTSNANDAERDAYYHVNVVHAFIKRVDPTMTGLDHPVPTRVNVNATCNAYWDGTAVNFYRAGGGCVNTGTMANVIYHEYGHGINDFTYIQHGSPNGMQNGALHEGMADVNAAFLQDHSTIGEGFFGPGTSLRELANTKQWPQDASGDPHATGLIIAGAWWDLRQSLGLPLALHLEHFAKYGTPDDVADDGVAMSEYFVETLIADDDDANLGNGTPHFNQIVAAFNAHGIGTGYFIHFAHAPLADQHATTPYPVTVNVSYSGAIGALDASSVTLHWSVNSGDWQTVAMTPTGNPNEFGASIPGQNAGVVHYWFSANDTYGAGSTDPAVAPDRSVYTFLAGPARLLLQQTMETDPGWTVGATGDNAMTGVWVRADPNGTEVSGLPCAPEDDHTPAPGTMCWVTGNGAPGENAGVSDVDGGKTTLTTNTFDASNTLYPVVDYWRWYTNALGSDPNNDWWRTYISNDNGATWKVVENTEESNAAWQRILFFIDDYVKPTATMKMKFVAQDSAAGSVVEAGIDDFRILDFTGVDAVGDPATGAPVLALAPATPNPAALRTMLRFSVPTRERATLRVYDVGGRAVRTLADGTFEAGPHAVEWDAADDAGRHVMPGPYFVRLASAGGGADLVRKVTIVR